jgi:hypothetical protein
MRKRKRRAAKKAYEKKAKVLRDSPNPQLPACCAAQSSRSKGFPRLNLERDNINHRSINDKKQFYKQGYTIIPHYFSRNVCEIIRTDLKQIIKAARNCQSGWSLKPETISGSVFMYQLYRRPSTPTDEHFASTNPPPAEVASQIQKFLVF